MASSDGLAFHSPFPLSIVASFDSSLNPALLINGAFVHPLLSPNQYYHGEPRDAGKRIGHRG